MILNGCASNSGISLLLASNNSAFSGIPHLQRRIASSEIPHSQGRIASFCCRSSWKPLPNIKSTSPLAILTGIASTPFVHGKQNSSFHAIPILPNPRLLPLPPRASTNEPQSSPLMTSEPRFWWRILSCIPYLLSFQETWLFAKTARYIHPVLEDFKFCNCPFLMSLGRIPRWFFFAYFFVGWLGVVDKKEWPHFFKFHVGTSLLLEWLFLHAATLTQFLSYTSGYLNQSLSYYGNSPELYLGNIGMHFWVFISFAFMFTVLECMRCALCGMYPNVPFISNVMEFMTSPHITLQIIRNKRCDMDCDHGA